MIYEFYVCSDVEEPGESVFKFALDTEQQTLTKVSGFSGISHPVYMAFNEDKSMLYAVQGQTEEEEGVIHAFRVYPGAPQIGTSDLKPEDLTESLPDRLEIERSLSTRGKDPCHVSVSESGRWVYVSNYASGSVAVFPVNEQGVLEDRPQVIQDEGEGKDPVRQDGPHVHAAYEKEEKVYIVDLGTDAIDVYEPSEEDETRLEDSGLEFKAPAGAGPRQVVFNDEYLPELYVLCELSSQVMIWLKEHGTWRLVDKYHTVQDDFEGENAPAAIKKSGNLVFVSNRGDDSIAVFKIINYGFLERTQVIRCGGQTPQDLEVLGDYVVAADRDSDLLTVFKINREETKLEATDIQAEVPKPVCVLGYRVPETPQEPEPEEESEEGSEEEPEEGPEEGSGAETPSPEETEES